MSNDKTIRPRFNFNSVTPQEGGETSEFAFANATGLVRDSIRAEIVNEYRRLLIEITDTIGNMQDIIISGSEYEEIGAAIKAINSNVELQSASAGTARVISSLFGTGVITSKDILFSATEGIDEIVPDGKFDAYVVDNLLNKYNVPTDSFVSLSMVLGRTYEIDIDPGLGIAEDAIAYSLISGSIEIPHIEGTPIVDNMDTQAGVFPVESINTITFTESGAVLVAQIDAEGLPIEEDGVVYSETNYDMIMIQGSIVSEGGVDYVNTELAYQIYKSNTDFTVDLVSGQIIAPMTPGPSPANQTPVVSGTDYYLFYNKLDPRRDIIQCGLYTDTGGNIVVGLNRKDGSGFIPANVTKDINNIGLYRIDIDVNRNATVTDIREYPNFLAYGPLNRQLGRTGINLSYNHDNALRIEDIPYTASILSKDKMDTYLVSGEVYGDEFDISYIKTGTDNIVNQTYIELAENTLDASQKVKDRSISRIKLAENIDNGLLSANAQLTIAKGGFWREVLYKDTDEIVIKPKQSPYGSFIGAVLNDGSYLESTTAITVKYDTPGNGGNIKDGITAKLTNTWAILWAYNDGSDNLAFALTHMPTTTISAHDNTTNYRFTLNQVNSQDIGLLFPEDAEIVLWNSSSKFTTPIYDNSGGAGSLNPTYGFSVDARTATTVDVGKAISTAFASGDTIYQVSNFRPLDVTTGTSALGGEAYTDTGIRLYIDGSSNLTTFRQVENYMIFGTGKAFVTNATPSTTDTVHFWLTMTPPDKQAVVYIEANNQEITFSDYWNTDRIYYGRAQSSVTGQMSQIISKHALIKIYATANGGAVHGRGYVL